MSFLYNLFSMFFPLFLIAVMLYLFLKSMKNTSTFQKLNRLTILACVISFTGLLFLGYGLLNGILGSLLVLLLIRISYVIYVDSN